MNNPTNHIGYVYGKDTNALENFGGDGKMGHFTHETESP